MATPELLRRLSAHGDLLPSLVITGKSDEAIAVEAMRAGASDFVGKAGKPTRIDRQRRKRAGMIA